MSDQVRGVVPGSVIRQVGCGFTIRCFPDPSCGLVGRVLLTFDRARTPNL